MSRATLSQVVVVAACLLAGACQGTRLRPDWSADSGGTGRAPDARPAAARPAAPRTAPAPRDGRVAVPNADLAPVDAWHGARNAQWILGTDVDVVASREYYAQILTLNERPGLVHRKDEMVGDDLLVTLTFVGAPHSASAMVNPRAQIGTGLTATARRTLRVRLMRTRDANRPVALRVVARGEARRGRGDEVLARGESLQLGGVLRRTTAGWRWEPFLE